MERNMRVCTSLCVAFGLAFAARVAICGAGPQKARPKEHVARLIRQLGHGAYVKREEASKKLEAIGAPALDDLRKAAATGDAEVRRRAERVIRIVTGRTRAAAARKELEKLQGVWVLASSERDGKIFTNEDKSRTMTFSGNKWVCKGDGINGAGTFSLVDVTMEPKTWDFTNMAAGITGYGVYQFDGDTFKYCAHDAGPAARPADFATKHGDGRYCLVWKWVKP